jgi:basic membrane lipoprotein Med (substrate-binding protein (PBP1-ABC) superfamily)
MRLPWLKLLLILAAIWLVAGGAMFLARRAKATPETLVAYVQAHPLEGKSSADRARIIEKTAQQLNELGYEERQQFRMGRKLGDFTRALTPAERDRFLDLTLPTGFKQMMESLNNMTPEKRQRFVEKALEDMKKREGERPPNEELDATGRKIIEQGFKSFYSEASAEVKMDVAPLIEQLQKNLQSRPTRGE